MTPILVFAEQREGKVKRVALEALGAARKLRPDAAVEAVLIGNGVASQAAVLASAGADKVHLVEDARFACYSSEGYASTLAEIAKQRTPSAILMGATAMGKDLGPKLAARLQSPFFGDCTQLSMDEGGKLSAVRPMYAGKILAHVQSGDATCPVVTLRPNLFDPASKSDGAPVVERGTPPLSAFLAVVKEVQALAASKVELTEARIIVSGGRGLRAPENFKLVEDLAEALGAAVGASRAAVDAGWKPHGYQVGLTGKTVSPLLYIACGISGAIQHQAGMSSAKYIVAINKDPNAPIFKIANYGIVGDLFEILPRLTAAIKQANSWKQPR
jgi:electron transfer flavoprotein alpha subunit